jgi:hypothetical protein
VVPEKILLIEGWIFKNLFTGGVVERRKKTERYLVTGSRRANISLTELGLWI